MKVITISGHAKNGKDTVAAIMEEELEKNGYRVQIMHYADLLKFICRKYLGWNGKKDEYGRTLLQDVGTYGFRWHDENFWVNFIAMVLEVLGDRWDYVLIPDARFPNEINVLKGKGFDVLHLRVIRSIEDNGLTEEQQQHESETALDDVDPDVYILNNGTFTELVAAMQEFTEHCIIADDHDYNGKFNIKDYVNRVLTEAAKNVDL